MTFNGKTLVCGKSKEIIVIPDIGKDYIDEDDCCGPITPAYVFNNNSDSYVISKGDMHVNVNNVYVDCSSFSTMSSMYFNGIEFNCVASSVQVYMDFTCSKNCKINIRPYKSEIVDDKEFKTSESSQFIVYRRVNGFAEISNVKSKVDIHQKGGHHTLSIK